MFTAGQQVMTSDGAQGRIVALTRDHVPRRIYVGDVCVPASVVLLDSGDMRWFADAALRPLTRPRGESDARTQSSILAVAG